MPMNVIRYGDSFQKRVDPWGRDYYWLTGGPPLSTPGHETDLSALAKGKVTLTPLDYDLTSRAALAAMGPKPWNLRPENGEAGDDPLDEPRPSRPMLRTVRRK